MPEAIQKLLFDPTVGRLVSAGIGIAVVIAIVKFLQRLVSRRVSNSDLRYRTRKFIGASGYVLAAVVLLTIFSDRLAGFTVAFGVAGAGIAFALQEVIASAAGWVAISFGNFYAPGDRVQLGGIKGDVIDIGFLRTTLMEVGQWVDGDLYNGRLVRIANSFVFKEPVFNYSGDFPFLWDEIVLPVRYGSDWQYTHDVLNGICNDVLGAYAIESKKAWHDVVREYKLEDASVEPMITLKLTDNWIEFTARYIVDYRKRRTCKNLLYRRFLQAVDASQERIRLASATFELVPGSFLDVRVSDQTPKKRPT
jgi:small-conductance mechanosensitive channel